MRFILPALFLSPLLVSAAIVCNIVDDGQVVEIRCYEDGTPSDPSATNIVMTAQACEELKNKAVSHLQDTYDLLETLHTNCIEALDYLQVSQDDANYVSGLVLDNSQQYTNGLYYSELAYFMSEMPSRISYAKEKVEDVDAQLLSARPPIQQAIIEIGSYPCSDGTCSGGGESGGTLGCPCAVEFQRELDVLTGIHTNLASVYAELVSVRILQAAIQRAVTNINEWVEAIGKRLDAPDDRMFGELQELYTRYFTNVTNIARGALNLQEALYNLKQLTRGEGAESGSRLQLTSEGVIGLHQLAFDMANFSANQAQFDQLNHILVGFTNQVMKYYNQFSIMSQFKHITPPTVLAKSEVYDVFTNDTVSPFQRYFRLVRPSLGVTNWFQRMELYQQAQLGWFDPKVAFSPSANQEQNTESSLEHQVMQTTNDLGRVNTEATNLVLSVESFVTPVFQDFAHAEITASLPTLVTLFPEIDVSAFHTSFGPIVWDTTDSVDMIEFARSVTTLVWRCSFWVMCVLLGVGISRVCMILVMYVIHIVKNL